MIAQVEDAIVAAIQSRVSGLDVWSHASKDVDELLDTLVHRAPACTVVFVDSDWERISSRGFKRVARFQVILVAESLRSERASRHGEGTETGAYAFIEAIELALIGQTLALEIDPISPQRTANLYAGANADRGLAIYGLEFETGWGFMPREDDGADLLEIEGRYTLQPAASAAGNDLITVEE